MAFSVDSKTALHYDQILTPALFEPFAGPLWDRAAYAGGRILETACGTGALTSVLAQGAVTACDTNLDMIAVARERIAGVRWVQADMVALPFSAESFSAVACGFGWMFASDKHLALTEAHRVLAHGGELVLSTWAGLGENPWAQVVQATATELMGEATPRGLATPFLFGDADTLGAALAKAGFCEVEVATCRLPLDVDNARSFAVGALYGNPLGSVLMSRGVTDLEAVTDLLAGRLADQFGDRPMRSTMTARLVRARKG